MPVLDFAWLILGLVLLYYGAEWLVAGAAGLARSFGISALVVGLTVVAYGTSSPEAVVGIQAALTERPEIVLGNVVGSNIANIGLILGLTALIKPPRVDGALPRREVPMLIATAALVPLLLLDDEVSRWEGAILVIVTVIYTLWMVRTSRRDVAEAREAAEVTEEAAETATLLHPPKSRARLAGLALAGLACLVVGGSAFVEGASGIALAFGMSERLVGLTIVAVGTSLPELATSLIAALRGHSDIAVGNIVGSNTFNVLFCLGAAAVVTPVGVSLASLASDLAVLGVITLAAAVLMRAARSINRIEGGLLLGGYTAYVVALVLTG